VSTLQCEDPDVQRLMKHARELERRGRKGDAEITYSAASEIARLRAWRPASEAPLGRWLLTWREGEDDWSRAMRVDEGEWTAPDGRTTATHSTYLPPTHFIDVALPA